MRKTDKFGTSSASVEKVQKDYDPYQFASWINIYLKSREAKTNAIKLDVESVCSFGSNKCNLDEDEQVSENEGETNDQKEVDIQETERRPNKGWQPSSKRQFDKVNKLSVVEQKQMQVMEDIEHKMANKKELKQVQLEDAEETYCSNLACELRKCSEEEKCMIKHEINILFKYQMNTVRSHAQRFSRPVHEMAGQSFHQGPPYS